MEYFKIRERKKRSKVKTNILKNPFSSNPEKTGDLVKASRNFHWLTMRKPALELARPKPPMAQRSKCLMRQHVN